MHRMGEERDMFEGLGWDKDIESLEDPHVPFNNSPERERSVAKRYRDDYEMTLLLQSTQAWKWKVEEEERQPYAKRIKMQADVMENDSTSCVDSEADDAVDLSVDIPWKRNELHGEDDSNDVEEEVKVVVESSRTLLSHERMKRLSPHHLTLKEWMKDRTMSYVDLL